MAQTEPLQPLRRIVAANGPDGNGVIAADFKIPAEPMNGLDHLRSGCIWVNNDGVPTNDNSSRQELFECSAPLRVHSSDESNVSEDGRLREVTGIVEPNGSNVRFTDLAPGASTPMHRTNSLDYNILVIGKLLLFTDDGSERLLSNPGDTVVQKGNMHAWKNPGDTWARWVTVILPARPVTINNQTLEEVSL